jgi:IS30 family transposase
MRKEGKSLRQIARQLGCSHSGIDVALRRTSRDPRPIEFFPRESNLKIEEREQILIGINKDLSFE